MERLIERGPRLRGGRRRLLRRAVLARRTASCSGQRIDEMLPAADADRSGKRDPRDFALWKGAKPASRRGRRRGAAAGRAGTWSARRWPCRYLGPDVRHPRRRPRPALPAPRERARPVAGGRRRRSRGTGCTTRWVTTAGEKMSKSLGNSLLVPRWCERVRPVELRYYLVAAALPLATSSSPRSAGRGRARLPADRGVRPAGGRGARRATRRAGRCCAPTFAAAMDDDLGVPRRWPCCTRRSRRATPRSPTATDEGAARRASASVRAMLGVLGARPARPAVGGRGRADGLRPVVDALVARRPRAARRRRGPARTSPRPTRSATRSRRRASPSRTPPTAPAGRWSRRQA